MLFLNVLKQIITTIIPKYCPVPAVSYFMQRWVDLPQPLVIYLQTAWFTMALYKVYILVNHVMYIMYVAVIYFVSFFLPYDDNDMQW